jgi:putative hydrolase of the HAD superfamily
LISEQDYLKGGLRAVAEHLAVESGLDPTESWYWMYQNWYESRTNHVFQDYLKVNKLENKVNINDLVKVYKNHTPLLHWRDGVDKFLPLVIDHGHHLALISDGELATQQMKWRSLHEPDWFGLVIFTDLMGRDFWKPNPWAFQRVMDRWPDASDYFYIADNPDKDFIAGNALGWRTVQINHPENIRKTCLGIKGSRAQIQIERFSDLIHYL